MLWLLTCEFKRPIMIPIYLFFLLAVTTSTSIVSHRLSSKRNSLASIQCAPALYTFNAILSWYHHASNRIPLATTCDEVAATFSTRTTILWRTPWVTWQETRAPPFSSFLVDIPAWYFLCKAVNWHLSRKLPVVMIQKLNDLWQTYVYDNVELC